MNREMERLAKTLSWERIHNVTNMLIDTQIAAQRISREEGEKAIAAILAIPPGENDAKDVISRYRALSRILEVAPYSLMRSFCQGAQSA